jgi:L-ascorbate metabolism protein UlaG (beta-lactamase superfamily)
MKKLILTVLSVIYLQSAFAQSDIIATSAGDVSIVPITHGTLVLTWNEKSIYIDPYGGAERFEGKADADLVLITDIHGDHHNQKTLDGLSLDNTTFIVPEAVADKLPETYGDRVQILGNGETTAWEGISIMAIPMYNLPESADSRHTKGRGNGYVLTIGDKNFYLSGDTSGIPEMRELKNIDVAFVCMNLPYTMDIEQAADAVADFQPAIVYPYHYRGQGGLSDVDAFKEKVNQTTPTTEVRLRDWYKK